MVAELGHYALALALAVALVQTLAPFMGASDGRSSRLVAAAAYGQFLLIGISYLALTYLFVVSDFSVRIVFENSYSSKPLIYRIAGVWGNHPGSMLLWVLILAFFGALVASWRNAFDEELKSRALAVQGLIGAAFLAFILFTSNPFARLVPAPLEGQDLNPVLQDPALAGHPPMLYVGYVGFSVAFALAMAGLINGRIDAAWGRAIRPWVLVSWVALTAGIALGSYWSYYELGWGGFWFWDPVENASLLPWLAGTALLHSAIVVERREALRAWTVLLAILAFAMSLLGTFLVRSGVLTSVHAFASNPSRGVFMLAIFVFFVAAALALYAWRAPSLAPGGAFRPVSREGALIVNNLLLASTAGAVLMGTLYPVVLAALTGDLVSVGPPYFNLVCGLLMAPVLLILPMGPLAPWKRAHLVSLISRLWFAALAAIVTIAVVFAFSKGVPIAEVLLMGAGVWLVVGALTDLADRAQLFRTNPANSFKRFFGLPREAFGTTLAHAGLGITLLGIAITGAFKSEVLTVLAPGQSAPLGSMQLTLQSVEPVEGSDYTAERGRFLVRAGNRTMHVISEKRHYWTRGVDTTEVGLLRRGASQVYVVLGSPRPASKAHPAAWGIHAFYHPFILFIWWGAGLMALGGLVVLSDRRMRVALIRRRNVSAILPIAGARPAE